MAEVILDRAELVRRVRDLQAQGRKVVFTEGYYDLLHVGHVRHLRSAKALGDVLLLALRSDGSIRRSQGAGRPLMLLEDRLGVLSSFEMVDLVTVFEEDAADSLLAELSPDIVARGEETRDHSIQGLIAEIVKRYGPKKPSKES